MWSAWRPCLGTRKNITPQPRDFPLDCLFACSLVRLFPRHLLAPSRPLFHKAETAQLLSSLWSPLLACIEYFKINTETGTWLSFATQKHVLGHIYRQGRGRAGSPRGLSTPRVVTLGCGEQGEGVLSESWGSSNLRND